MGKFLYAIVFVVILPIALVAWARATSPAILLPTPHWPVIGYSLAAIGLAIILESMRELWFKGGGLPMNAYPPHRLVNSGLYALIPHPIYAGFCAACLGLSLATGSSGGLWLVTPIAILGCFALVKGYEGPALRTRFENSEAQPFVRPPEVNENAPSLRDRAAIYLLLFLPWVILYEGWGHAQPDSVLSAALSGESQWPVFEWTTFIYSLAYPFTLAVPLMLRKRSDLYQFFVAGLLAIAILFLLYIVLPIKSPPRPFDSSAFGGWLLKLERADDLRGAVAFPSFHVVWVVLSAAAYSRLDRTWSLLAWITAVAISISCITTGMHIVADVAAALPIAFAVWNWRSIWFTLVRACERIANSWSCLQIGPVRVINYAAYAGLAAAIGVFLTLSLAGTAHSWHIGTIALAALIGAALSEQILVGSPSLLRPFGYFGAITGSLIALAVIAIVNGRASFWTLAAALCVSAPWVVIIGRLRCLVQGCCHGGPSSSNLGIRYRHTLSRACRIANLHNIPTNPTPLYSMISNVVIGLMLARLWCVSAPLSMIAGLYLVLAGLARFVEEALRGEPQTRTVAGLHTYQWFAIVSVVVGASLTATSTPHVISIFEPSWPALYWAIGIGTLYACAMGVDFPKSNRLYSRLT